jgi:flagellar hook-basal body complex protein FliE
MTPLLPIAASLIPAVADVARGAFNHAGAGQSAADPASFAAMMRKAAGEAASALGEAEAISIKGVQGAASIQEVATKVMAAERAVQTAIALRDRFVGALQEVSRMQV